MEIIVKKAAEQDRDQCIAIEKAAMKGAGGYLEDVWDYFSSSPGDLSCAYMDGKMVGIGKFTLLYDGSAWLETLRVDPGYQGLGVGKKIYENYFVQARKHACKSMAMYTGVSNKVSAGLASRFGFRKTQTFRGYKLRDFTPSKKRFSFEVLGAQEGAKRILSQAQEYQGYMVSNRTFYRINPPTALGFSQEGRVFEDAQKDSFILCGARFQSQISLHISMMAGDHSLCLAFAKELAASQGIPQITCTVSIENQKMEKFLLASGFEAEVSDLIRMEVCL